MNILSVIEKSYKKIGSPKRIAVAVSGGADSMALLYALYQLKNKLDFEMLCIHINHGLREEAVLEEQKLLDFCSENEIKCVSVKVNVEKKGSLELNARNARYAAFDEIRKKEGFDVLALAHHKIDQAETVLMRLFYGTGVKGLSGIRELNAYLWRPLLSLEKAELEEYLCSMNIDYSIDKSNFDTKFTRNAIRHSLLPKITRIYPKALDSIYRLSNILQAESDYIEDITEKWIEGNALLMPWLFEAGRDDFNLLNVALKRRVLFKAFDGMNIDKSFESIELIIEALENKETAKLNLPNDANAVISDKLSIISKSRISEFMQGRLKEKSELTGYGDGVFRQAFDLDKVRGAELRTRKAGDKFMLFGSKTHKSLKEFMIDKKIPRLLRDDWPIYALGNEVLWVIGVACSGYGIIDASTSSEIRLEYLGVLPDGRKN